MTDIWKSVSTDPVTCSTTGIIYKYIYLTIFIQIHIQLRRHFLPIVEAPPPSGPTMGILDKIAEIEKEISKTQKNKATEYHLGCLKAKLAK